MASALLDVLPELLRSLRRRLSRLAQADIAPKGCGVVVIRHPGKDEHALLVTVLMDRRANFGHRWRRGSAGVAAEVGPKAKK